MIESDNAIDDTLSGFCFCGSANKFGGSRASDLAALGVGWEEWLFRFYFPSSGAKFLLCCLLLNLVTVGCVFNLNCSYIL